MYGRLPWFLYCFPALISLEPVVAPLGSHAIDHRNGVLVERSLRHHGFDPVPVRFYTATRATRQLADAERFLKVLDEFQPEIVNWWNMHGITKSILSLPAVREIPDVYCLDDTWMIREYGVSGMCSRYPASTQ